VKPVWHDAQHNSCLRGTVILCTSLFIYSYMYRYLQKRIVSCHNINVLCTVSKHCTLKYTLHWLRFSGIIPSFCSLSELCFLSIFMAWVLKRISILCLLVSCMCVHVCMCTNLNMHAFLLITGHTHCSYTSSAHLNCSSTVTVQ